MALASLTYYPLYTALGNYADPKNLNYGMSIFIVVILVNYVGMTYGPIGAFLAEFFPSRIRYTSVSVLTTSETAGAAAWYPSSRPQPFSTPEAWAGRSPTRSRCRPSCSSSPFL